MMKIKLAICISSLRVGGAERMVVDLIEQLNQEIFIIYVFVLEEKGNTILEERLSKLNIPINYINKKAGFNPLAIIKLTKMLRTFKPDIIHAHLGGVLYSLLYAYLYKTKIIQTVHTLASHEYSLFKRLFIKYAYRKKIIIPVGVSQEISNSIKKLYSLDRNVITIYNGIDLLKYHNPKYKTKITTIGHIGRFERVKNHKTIIEVYKELKIKNPHLKLLLIGDGSYKKQIEELITQYNLTDDVIMPGYVNDVSIYLEKIDLFLMPSLYEGMPLALLEAMANGCIIIASAVGGIKDLISNLENGYLINEPYDKEEFVIKIEQLINNPSQVKQISQNNMQKSTKYSLKAMKEQYEDLYLSFVKQVR